MIKKFLLVLLFIAGQAFATEVKVDTENNNTEVIENESVNIKWNSYSKMNIDFTKKAIDKPIFFFVGNSNCKYCLQEINDIRNKPSLVKLLNEKFYVVHVNQDLEEIPMELTVSLTPTMHIMNPSSLKRMTPDSVEGLVPVNQLEDYLMKIDSAYEYYKKTKALK